MKTNELAGRQLDYAVAIASGATGLNTDGISWWVTLNGKDRVIGNPNWLSQSFCPSTLWEHGGKIIEAEGISLRHLRITDNPFRWCATQKPTIRNIKPCGVYGESALVAAMRCFVTSKIGGEVEIPRGLA